MLLIKEEKGQALLGEELQSLSIALYDCIGIELRWFYWKANSSLPGKFSALKQKYST